MPRAQDIRATPTDGRRRRGDATRSRLVEAAAAAFATHGFHGTSYGDLIAATRLSKGACYHHFPSKQALARAVLDVKQSQVIAASMAGLDALPSPLATFFAALRNRSRAFVRDRSLRSLPRLAADLAQDSRMSRVVRQNHRAAIAALAGMLRAAEDARELRPGTNVETVARIAFTALVGLDELSERETGGADREQRTEDLIAVLQAALEPLDPAVRPSRRRRAAHAPQPRTR
jgi:AcrR family transcriptional regulator